MVKVFRVKQGMRRIAYAALCGVLCMAFVIPGSDSPTRRAIAASSPTASIDPASQNVATGASFSIAIHVDPAGYGVSGGELRVAFDPAAMTANGITYGGLLGGSIIESPGNYIDNTGGTILYALARVGATSPPTPAGVLATISFTAGTAVGAHPVDITGMRLSSESFVDIPGIVVQDGSITVGSGWSVGVDVTCNVDTVSATFGLAENATGAYDAGMDQVAPSPTDPGQQAYFYYPGNTPTAARKLSTSWVPPAAEVVFPLKVNYIDVGPAESDVAITWNVSQVPSQFTITLKDLQTLATTDMLQAKSYTFHTVVADGAASQLRSFEIVVVRRGPYTLNVSAVGTGGCDPAPGSHLFDHGTAVSLTASETDPCYAFAGFLLDGEVHTENPFVVTMDSDKTVTAGFVRRTYSLTVNVAGSGSVTVEGNTPAAYPAQFEFNCGAEVTVEAVPSDSLTFTAWTGDLTSSASPVTVLMDSDKSMTASFSDHPGSDIPDSDEADAPPDSDSSSSSWGLSGVAIAGIAIGACGLAVAIGYLALRRR